MREFAIEAWIRASKARYVDAGGGAGSRMLLLYAAKAQGLPALEAEALRMLSRLPLLKADLKPPNSRPGWPRPLASFALGQMTRDDVRQTLSHYSTEKLQPLLHKYSSQAEFYFGVLSQDTMKRKEHFWRAGYDYVPASYGMAEHHLAIFEFNALKNISTKVSDGANGCD